MTDLVTVGSARRFGNGVRFRIFKGQAAGHYGIAEEYAESFLNGVDVPVHKLTDDGPVPTGLSWKSKSGKTLTVRVATEYGNAFFQIPKAHLAGHYDRGDREAVEVLADRYQDAELNLKAENARLSTPRKGVRMAVV
jgi:hypothetical protein